MPASTGMKADLRDYLAAERTFLAWIRTGLALMGFGFVVARFGLYLQQLQLAPRSPSALSYGMSLWFGTALIAAGVFVYLLSAWHHLRLVRELNRGGPISSRPSLQAVIVALFLALVGLAMVIYLIRVHSSTNPHFENNKEISMQTTAARGIIIVWQPKSTDSSDAGSALERHRSSSQGPDLGR
jgi:putative membrane protein